jgi:hypothetical protein
LRRRQACGACEGRSCGRGGVAQRLPRQFERRVSGVRGLSASRI